MRHTNLTFALSAALLFLASACSKDRTDTTHPLEQEVVLKNVRYGDHPQQQMDVYLPANRDGNKTRIAVLIHGGAWAEGDKGDLGLTGDLVSSLMASFPGYAFFNLNYRLVKGTENQYPAAENDVKQAMDFIYSQSGSYGISTETYLIGGSAGAHLAALQTLEHNNKGFIKGCIGISGAYDLKKLYEEGNAEAKLYIGSFMGGSPADRPDAYAEANPLNFVDERSPKFLLLHGSDDSLTPVSQAQAFKEALDAAEVENDLYTYPGGHSIPPQYLPQVFEQIRDFLP